MPPLRRCRYQYETRSSRGKGSASHGAAERDFWSTLQVKRRQLRVTVLDARSPLAIGPVTRDAIDTAFM